MTALLALFRKELIALSRDLHGLLVLFAMPAIFILVMSLALRDTFHPRMADTSRWRVWDGDATVESAALIAALPVPALPPAGSRAELEAGLARGTFQLGLEIAPGYGGRLGESETGGPLVAVLAEPGMPPSLVAAFQEEVARALVAQRVRALIEPFRETARIAGVRLPDPAAAGSALLETRFVRHSHTELTSVQQSVPAWLVFGMFFVVVPLSTVFIAEKQQGTLPRLQTIGLPMPVLLAGKVTPFYLVNLGQAVAMLLVGRFVVPLFGGDVLQLDVDLLAFWAMASAVSLAAIGFALAVAAFARTMEQATAVGGAAAILFGALGGVMAPKLIMPLALQQATWFSPMAWGLEGLLDVMVRGAHLGDLTCRAGPLLGFAACCLGLAAWRLGRKT